MKLFATVVVRIWGGSHGIVVPIEVVKKLNIEAGDTIVMSFEKPL